MSELEKIVDHVVQHEEKRQAEKIKLESEIKALEEVLEHGISTKFVEEEVIYVYSPKTAHDMREKLEENYKQLHAQLTIPKNIADKLDFIYDNHFDSNDDISWVIANIDFLPTDEDYYNFDGWINLSVDNHNLALAYLAGKALGVELVKVVEG